MTWLRDQCLRAQRRGARRRLVAAAGASGVGSGRGGVRGSRPLAARSSGVTAGPRATRAARKTNVEWRLNNRVSVETSYDNVNDISSSALGNLGADVRWRLEFE